MGGLMLSCAQSGLHEDVAKLGKIFLNATPDPEAMPIYIESACFLAVPTVWRGLRREATAILARMNEVAQSLPRLDGMSQAWLTFASGYFDHFLDARPWRSRTWAEAGAQALLEINTDRKLSVRQALAGLTLAALGEVPGAIEVIRLGVQSAYRPGQDYVIAHTRVILALVLVSGADPAHHSEAQQLALEILNTQKMNVTNLGLAHIALAKVALLRGVLTAAEEHARKACEVLGLFRVYYLIARTTLCTALLAQQRSAEARAEAEQGVTELEQMGPPGAIAVAMRLALVEACFAQGDQEQGNVALLKALQCVHLRAADIPDAAARERFLSQVPENARVRELARQRWGTDAS